MRAVWSFWSRPFQAHRYLWGWRSELHHLLAWGLSVRTASRHYPETVLITDRPGKTLLVDQLALPFLHVSTELERLRDVDPGWWAIGKLVAYSLQDQPFVHIDSDAFLWRPLPQELAASSVFAQCPEYHANDPWGSPAEIERAFAKSGGKLPIEWEWERSKGDAFFRQESCGILGGRNVEFLRYYARTALDFALRPENAAAWSQLPDKSNHNFTLEQFVLAACIDFHRYHPTSPHRGVKVKHLFSSVEEACDINQAARLGYTHLWGPVKSHPAVGRRLEERMRREDPIYFRRCQELLAANRS